MRTAVVGHVEWVDFARVARVPPAGSIIHADRWWSEPGGGGPGAAVQLLRLAGECTLFTALGDDELGHRALAALTTLGLRVEAVFRPERQRRAFVHIDGTRERTITVMGSRLGPHGDDPLPWDLLEQADCVYFTAGDSGALRAARRARVLVATARALAVVRSAGVRSDAIVGSATDPAEQIDNEFAPAPTLIVRTDGARGGTFRSAGSTHHFDATAPAGPVVDAYGAGDAFAGGLTFALGAGSTPREAVELAARCGAAALTGRGPFEGLARRVGR